MDVSMVNRELDLLIEQGETLLKTSHTVLGRVKVAHLSGQILERAPSTDHVDWEGQKLWATQIDLIMSNIIEMPEQYAREFEVYRNNTYTDSVSLRIKLLVDIKSLVERGLIAIQQDYAQNDSISNLHIILQRFHKIVRQLRNRHNKRNTLEINDEYDVQDLLHALLHIYFDDIRAEEWTPSYAGSSSRQDFLLKDEQVVIEVKKTRATMTDRELGEQLIVDIDKYKAHQDCKFLICFVYDPEGFLGNPKAIMNDLNSQHEGFVEVIIVPE